MSTSNHNCRRLHTKWIIPNYPNEKPGFWQAGSFLCSPRTNSAKLLDERRRIWFQVHITNAIGTNRRLVQRVYTCSVKMTLTNRPSITRGSLIWFLISPFKWSRSDAPLRLVLHQLFALCWLSKAKTYFFVYWSTTSAYWHQNILLPSSELSTQIQQRTVNQTEGAYDRARQSAGDMYLAKCVVSRCVRLTSCRACQSWRAAIKRHM